MASVISGKQTAISKGAVRRRRLFFSLLALFSLWAVFAFWNQLGALQEKKMEMSELQQKLNQLKLEHEAYQLEVTRLQDPEYIEQRVRKDFGMTRPGDKLFGTPAE